MVFRFKVEKKVNTVVPAVKLGCFVVHLGGLKTLPKQGYVIGLFAILYCCVRSLIGQFVINGSAAVSSFSGFVVRHWYFGPAVCLFDAKIDANLPNRYNLSSNIVSGKQGKSKGRNRRPIHCSCCGSSYSYSGSRSHVCPKAKVLKVEGVLEKNKFLTWI